MAERCQRTNQDGSPCGAKPWKDGLCRWHHPDLAADRRAWSAKGGANRSNATRARKAIAGDLRDLGTVQATMLGVLKKLEAGTIEPGVATAMANVSRALVSVAQASAAVDFERQLADMARQLAELRERRGA